MEASSSKWAMDRVLKQQAAASTHVETDLQLCTRVQQQNRAALEMLYERHSEAAMGLAVFILQEHERAEHVVQEAFSWLWKYAALAHFRQGDFTDWFFGIVRHLAITELNRTLDLREVDTAEELALWFKQNEVSAGAWGW